jgi:serine protease Do
MAAHRLRPFLCFAGTAVAALMLAVIPGVLAADDSTQQSQVSESLHPALLKPIPESIQDLQAIEAHVKRIVAKVMPTIVNVKNGAQGSGIVVTDDGFVLTAGHVSATPGKDCTITFPNGKKVKGKSLGQNVVADSGLIKIVDEGNYPFCEMGNSADVKKGDWCIAIGHPGGWKEGRTPPVRLGRIIAPLNGQGFIQTETTLVGGDSGGPLFDMHGKVIGIHSRIGQSLTQNMHVPVDKFREEWDRLVKSESWGGKGGGKGGKGNPNPPAPSAKLGVTADEFYEGKGIRIAEVAEGSAAAKAGLKVGDIIITFKSKAVSDLTELRAEITLCRPGDEVAIEVRRGQKTLTLKATLDKADQ